jgi:hypothetical protein
VSPENIVVAIGQTGLLGWACLQIVALGKKAVRTEDALKRLPLLAKRVRRIERKLDNGITEKLGQLSLDIKSHIDGEEERLLKSLERGGLVRDPRARTRATDQQA